MLKPLNIIVFDSEDIFELLAAQSDVNHADMILGEIAEYLYDGEGIASVYLFPKEEQKYHSECDSELADIIVANSELNYGDTAYIMF